MEEEAAGMSKANVRFESASVENRAESSVSGGFVG